MKFDPDVHEFSGEVRRPKKGEMFLTNTKYEVEVAIADLYLAYPIIIPRRKDIRWAWERMSNGYEVIDPLGRRHRYSGLNVQVFDVVVGAWVDAVLDDDHFRGEWSEPASPADGTLEWAREYVKSGGAVWFNAEPLIKYTSQEVIQIDFSQPMDWRQPNCESGWHLWGDREWLLALPDGTRVRGASKVLTHREYIKDADRLFAALDGKLIVPNSSMAIRCAPDFGWDLAREPERAKPTPITHDWPATADALSQDIADVSADLAALAERVKRLEER